MRGLLRGAGAAQVAKMGASLPLVHFFDFLL
jgi:hypothetical protein